MTKKMMMDARDFFQEENSEFKKEMEIETLLVDIACEFIRYRDNNGLTQKDLADKLEITQAMVSKLESGDYNPTVKLLFEIAQKLSWNFNIEFNQGIEKIDYQFEDEQESIQNLNYMEKMGLAS